MPCPLYIGLTSGNPLEVCGPKDRLGCVPSSAHMKLFCLSLSAYNGCPMYKKKTFLWEEQGRWPRLFKQISDSFLQKRGREKD